ncbi:MAG: hypothetical protein FJX34_03525, partial [Alphaproteobacteria bacterium]|nr:hypothetical protein [Alphaproteobacteria bacterium]
MLSRLVLALFLCLPSCLVAQKISITGRGDIKLKEVSFSELTSWANDDHKKALQSFLNSCDKFAKMPQKRVIGGQIGDITAGDFRDVCDIANIVKTMTSAQAKNFFENWFRPFTVETRFGLGSGLFTGYYEASLNGSKVKTEKFQYPIYAKPKDLDLTRAEIEDGVLKGKGLELLYTDDKVALFFMQIQGSGRAKMPDGAEVRLSFAARNNQPFVPVVNYMSKQGYLKKGVSVREWLKANPDKMDAVMNTNPAYTFFK